MKSGARWLSSMMLISRHNPVSLLDNGPLRQMLERNLDFRRIQNNIDSGALYAACVTASGGGVTIGPMLLGAARPVHILTPSATVRRIVNMTAVAVADANAPRGQEQSLF